MVTGSLPSLSFSRHTLYLSIHTHTHTHSLSLYIYIIYTRFFSQRTYTLYLYKQIPSISLHTLSLYLSTHTHSISLYSLHTLSLYLSKVYVHREIERVSVCREKERDGREPVTIRLWLRMRVRIRVIWHVVLWHFFPFFILWHFILRHFVRIPYNIFK